jgi:hypothetical protein
LREALAVMPGVQVKVGFGGSSGEKYILVLASENGPLLTEHARIVERELRTLPGIGAVTSTASLVRPELVIRPDFARMADLGVTSAAIADTLRIATAGDYDQSWPSSTSPSARCPSSSSCRPAPARTSPCSNADGARQARAGDDRQRRHAGHRRRAGRDRPLRPPAQRQFRDRAERPAARRESSSGRWPCPA